ncbi:MAG: hypothetical protein CVU44_14950 [Chloroflexi bacterium HGW-Chloroflexi-6]|nr:MAG: hypothetical protein CVU44_14950 [Chloroflexi bacterium HGW-Chloroflexi-6]
MSFQQFFLRLAIFLAIGLVLGILINEVSFSFMKSEAGRAAQRIELVIPAGTAAKIARGEAEEAIPLNMVFVNGDILVVKNEDTETHTLGPLLIPAGTSASLNLDQTENLALSCSFQPGQYIGLDVREAVTLDTRLLGIFLSGVPLGILFMLYSFIIWPIKNKPQVE